MKLLRFLILIFQKGSLRNAPFDFEAERMEVLNEFKNRASPHPFSFFKRVKQRSTKNKILYSIISNLSYLRHAGQMNIMLFVSTRKQLVYCRILKSASTSMLKEMLPSIDPTLEGCLISDDQVDALAFRYVKRKLATHELSYPKFALIRNPFHRIVSVYLDLFNPSSNHFSYESYWFGILKSNMTFVEFVNIIEQIPDFLKGPHFAPQHYILSDITKLNTLSYFRIDKDQDPLKHFLIQYEIILPYQNKQARQYDYKLFYNSDLLSKVYEMYRLDVTLFGYEDEYHQLSNFVSDQENRME